MRIGNQRNTLTCLALFAALCAHSKGQGVSVSASPQNLTVYPGQTNVALTVSVASTLSTNPLTVSLSGLPSGVAVSPASLSVAPGSSGTFLLNVGLNADQENFTDSIPLPNQLSSSITVVGASGSSTVTSTFTLNVLLSNPNYAPSASQINLPVVNINTSGVPITSTSVSVPGTITITSANGSTSYLPNSSDSDNTANFQLHGNTTASMPKAPYSVKLNTSLDLLTQMGLSCPYVSSKKAACDKSKSYILLANYDDKSLLRDWSASALANAIPYGGSYLAETAVPSGYTGTIPTPSGSSTLLPWAPHSLFVELYLNGQYEGNYQLIEKVNVDSHRINITELGNTSSGDLSGGYLLEIDQRQAEDYTFVTPQGVDMGLLDPDYSPEVSQQTTYITNYVNQAESALFSSSFTSPTTGWRAYFDEASAINYYIVNEVMANIDGGDFYSSDYLYKAADNPFLYMGPIWDFDISSGNTNYSPAVNPTVFWMQVQSPWYARWFQDPGFKADLTKQWNTLKNNNILSGWLASIQAESTALEQSQASNFARWPILGETVWPNAEAAGSYDAEVAYLLNYLNLRIDFLDSQFNAKTATSISFNVSAGAVSYGSSETLTASVTGGSSPTGSVFFLANNVVVGSATLDRTGTATLVTNRLPIGSLAVQAIYGGDNTNALSQSAWNTVSVSPALSPAIVSLASSASPIPAGGSVTFSVSVTGTNGSSVPSGTVVFSANGAVIGSSSLSGSGTASLTYIGLTASSNTVQASYSGDAHFLSASSNVVTVAVDAASIPVTFSATPAGLSFSVDGVTYTSTEVLGLDAGSTHTVTTYTPQPLGGAEYAFSGWSDGGAMSHTIVVPAAAISYTASFVPAAQYTLTTSVSPGNLGTVAVSPSASSYPATSVVGLSAIPGQSCVLQSWTGNVANSAAANTTITMNANQSVMATFGPSVSGIDFGGSNGAPWCVVLNGSATDSATRLELTNESQYGVAGSAYAATAVNVQSFTNDFTFQLSDASADGFTFTLQNAGLGAIGGNGYMLGSGGIPTSVSVKFDLFNSGGEGNDSTGLYLNGAVPAMPAIDLTPSGVNLHSGDLMQAHMTYDGATLTVSITDTVTNASATQTYVVDIPTTLGGTTAYAGFTGGTGGLTASQDIFTWRFDPGTPVGNVSFAPAGGTYATTQQITLSSSTSGAAIYYTLDGSSPTANSSLYTGPITVSSNATLEAIAIGNGVSSQVAAAVYRIVPTALATVPAQSAPYSQAGTAVSATITFTASKPTGAVTFTVDGNPAVLATCTAGSGQELCTATVAGPISIGSHTLSVALAGDSTYSAASGIGTLTVTDVVSMFSVTGIPATVMPGTAYTVTVNAIGTLGSIVTGFDGTVTLSSTDAAAIITPSTYTFTSADAGSHAFLVTFLTGGPQSVSVQDDLIMGAQSGLTVGSSVWLIAGDGSRLRLNEAGSLVTTTPGPGGTVSWSGGLAVDGNGGVWSVSSGIDALSYSSPAGTSTLSFSGAGLNAPTAVAVDGQGYIWVANSGSATVSRFTSSGAAVTGTAGYGSGKIGASPSSLVVDAAGGLWITGKAGNSVTHVIGAASPVVPQ